MKRVLALVVTMMALSTGLTVASSASAAPADQEGPIGVTAWWDCPEGYFCAWRKTNGDDSDGNNKPEFMGKVGAPDLNEFKLNDHVWSVWNRTGVVWCAYPDNNYSDVNGKDKAPNPWPIGNWRGNTSEYSMQNYISSFRRGACTAG